MTLLPINKIEKIAEKRVDVRQIDVYENSISGDAIHGGLITDFNSTGIKDQSDSLQITATMASFISALAWFVLV